MIPVVTPQRMGEIDRASATSFDVLVQRAGAAVARAAVDMLGGTYGRTVVVVAGPGNNGADGRVAAEILAARGVRCMVVDASEQPSRLPAADLVIDAAYGTGFRGTYQAPDPGEALVLSVDIPTGLEVTADRTVTFAALKPDLLFGVGPQRAGVVDVVDIGLEITGEQAHLVTDADVADAVPRRPADAHKWTAAVTVVGGSAGMEGAPALAAAAAFRSGAGYVRVSGGPGFAGSALPVEAVSAPLDVAELDRFGAVVVGPGLGRSAAAIELVRSVVTAEPACCVIDGDGLWALANGVSLEPGQPVILTPHDGEYRLLSGSPPGADRVAAARELAERFGAVVLLKGPTTVVATPDQLPVIVRSGDQRLATAGTGDVLAGIIAALAAMGATPTQAAWCGAMVHGRAASLGSDGLVAGDLPGLVPAAIESLRRAA